MSKETYVPQVGGSHYQQGDKPQHWDLVAMYDWDYFQAQVTKYLMRWRSKNGVEDLKKAASFLAKYIALVEAGLVMAPIAPKEEKVGELGMERPLANLKIEGYIGEKTVHYKCLDCNGTFFAATPAEIATHYRQCATVRALPSPAGT
jgi:hypothetical protein